MIEKSDQVYWSAYQEAKEKFLSGDFTSEVFFEQNDLILEEGYCKLFSGDVTSAQKLFLKVSKFDFRADWALKLIQFINCYVSSVPSYFQIRNFLEIDLNLLLKFGQPQFVENIINGADIFYSINPESYKFIARVMLNNDFTEVALFYLNKAKEKFYNDPEMHYMLANCYLKENNINSAKESLDSCLGILPGYLPAKKMLDLLN